MHLSDLKNLPVTELVEMAIANDDALFGPLKSQCECQSLLPEAVPQRHRIYSDSDDDDDYYANYHGEEEDEDNEDDEEDEEEEDEEEIQG